MVLCGLIAGATWHLLCLASLALSGSPFLSTLQGRAPHAAQGGAFFLAVDLLMGIWAVWLYSAIAPRYGAGPMTAVVTGVAWWVIKTLQSAKWAGLGFVEINAGLLPLGALTLMAGVLASGAGAWFYNRAISPAR
jgi:hypothetical protein